MDVMRTIYTVKYFQWQLFFLLGLAVSGILSAQTTAIPDPNFEQALINLGIDSDGIINGQVLTSDIDTVTTLTIRYKNITNLTGIEGFASLASLDVRGNHLTSLETSQNLNLSYLDCTANPLTFMDISANALLKTLNLSVVHRLRQINLSGNYSLETLILDDTWINTIDLSDNLNLKTLLFRGIPVSDLNLSNNLQLEYIDVFGANLSELDVSNNVALKELVLGNIDGVVNQEISSLDLSNNTNLEVLYAQNLFNLEYLNLKNGNNTILNVELSCYFEDEPCSLNQLSCVLVDDEMAAQNNAPPYNTWYIEADFRYSESCVVGIDSPETSGIFFFPNPVSDKLYMNFPFGSERFTVSVFDTNGRLLQKQNGMTSELVSVDVSRLADGLYLLEAVTDRGESKIQRFLKQ